MMVLTIAPALTNVGLAYVKADFGVNDNTTY
jgi:hypothetical protein